MNEDGRMARLDDLIKFSKKHKIKIASIADLIAYRLKNEKLVFKSHFKNMHFDKNNLVQFSVFKNKLNQYESYTISKGKFDKNKPAPIRVLSKKIKGRNLLDNKEIKKNIKILSKYKNFILIVINNEISNEKKTDTDLTLDIWYWSSNN